MANLEQWLESFRDPEYLKPGTPLLFESWFLGRYEITQDLGAGTTAVACRAVDTVIDREIVLKLWRKGWKRAQLSQQMFLDEARTLGRIRHPNVVEVYDFAELPLPWMTLEYLGQRTLRMLLHEGPQRRSWPGETSHITLQIAALLEYLHDSASIFQLDLKPDNLAIVGERQIIKIMDFGSVVGVGRTSNRQWRYGTPGYLAPEMFVDQELTPSCDIFAFGALLFELITGARPFEDMQSRVSLDAGRDWFRMPTTALIEFCTNEQERHEWDVLSDSVRAEMASLDIRAELASHRLPMGLTDLIAKMLAFDSRQRPSGSDVRLELERLSSGEAGPDAARVFISHADADKERFVNTFARRLKRRGFDVWLDEWNLRVGDPFWEAIGEALEQSRFIIVVLSRNSVTSLGVAEELRTAHALSMGSTTKVLPIRIDPIDFKAIPISLRARQVLDFVGWQDSSKYARLIAKLAADMRALQMRVDTH